MTTDTRKTTEQIDAARQRLCERIQTPGLPQDQSQQFVVALYALGWAAGNADAILFDRLLSDEPINVKRPKE